MACGAVLLATAGAATGAGLTAVGNRWGAGAMLGLPVAAAMLVVVLSRRSFAIYAFLLTLPFGFIYLGPLQAVELAALLVVAVVAVARSGAGLPVLPPVPQLAWALALGGVAALASLRSVDADATFRANVQLGGGVMLAFAVTGALTRANHVRRFAWGLVGVATVMSLPAIQAAGDQSARFGAAVITGRATGVFAQPNELGLFSAMALLVATGVFVSATTARARIAAVVAILAVAASLVLSLSRGAWLGSVMGVAALVVLLPAFRKRLAVILLVALAVAGIGLMSAPENPQVQIIGERLATFTDPSANPYDERPLIYQEAFRQISERPLLGQGPGSFPAASARAAAGGRTFLAYHAHNALLTVAAEAGIVAALLVVALTLSLAVTARRTVSVQIRAGRPADAAITAGLASALAALAGHGLIDYPLRNPVVFLLVWCIVGALLASERAAPDVNASETLAPAKAGALQ